MMKTGARAPALICQAALALLPAMAAPTAVADGLGGGGSDPIVIVVPDGTPDPFTFGEFADALPGSTITAGPLQPTGFDTAVQVSVENGAFHVILAATLGDAPPACDGRFDVTPQVIGPGDYVCVRQQASRACGAARTTTLHVGLASGTLRTVTVAAGEDLDADGVADCRAATAGSAGLSLSSAIVLALLLRRRRQPARG